MRDLSRSSLLADSDDDDVAYGDLRVDATALDGTSHAVWLDREPEYCPRCHRAGQMEFRYARFHAWKKQGLVEVQAVFQCPARQCQALFFAHYELRYSHTGGVSLSANAFTLREVGPRRPNVPTVPPEVAATSPRFSEIYRQAAAAEAYELPDVAGPGYRKALEFLVKDYLIQRSPKDAASIRTEFLSSALKRVDDPRIQAAAERAAWLGNDETHYERRWEGKDLQDLKRMIALTVNWIHSSLLTAQIVTEMPPSQTKK